MKEIDTQGVENDSIKSSIIEDSSDESVSKTSAINYKKKPTTESSDSSSDEFKSVSS